MRRKGLGDGDELPITRRKQCDWCVSADVCGPHSVELTSREDTGGAAIHQAVRQARLSPERHIFGDREGRHQLQFLRNNCNPCGDCFARRREVALYAADGERSFVTDQATTQEATEGGFPGAVLADYGVHLSGEEIEVD